MRKTKTHVYFYGGIYSQWSKSPFKENGKTFKTAEHYMMYHKALLFEPEKAIEILKTNTPKEAKAMGRNIKNFDAKVWEEKCMDIVTQGNILKFSQNKELLKTMLQDNPKILVEASPVDKIWGIGLHYDDNTVLNEKSWKGTNKLGICLMRARNHILNKQIKGTNEKISNN